MKQVVKFLIVAEIEVDSHEGGAVAEAQARLDSFRESVLPSENYGLTLYRASANDLTAQLLNSQVEVTRPPDEAPG
jgi:hypothetical protein